MMLTPTSLHATRPFGPTRGAVFLSFAAPAVVLLVLVVMVLLLRAVLHGTVYDDAVRALMAVPRVRIVGAMSLTAIAYVLLASYDIFALRYVGVTIPVLHVVGMSALSHGLSQMLGFPLVTGHAVRVRFWAMWGLSADAMARAAAFVTAMFTIGVVAASGLALLFAPTRTLDLLHTPPSLMRIFGVGLLLVVAGVVVWSRGRAGRAVRVVRWSWPVPTAGVVAVQLAIAILEWFVASLVLFVLLPPAHGIALLPFVCVFIFAQTAGVVSHVPGGLGVMDTIVVFALRPVLAPTETMVALVAYRAVYYLLPFVAASIALAVIEIRRKRADVVALLLRTRPLFAHATRYVRVLQPLVPVVIGVATFCAGVILLVSGATPALTGRVRTIASVLPLGLLELSHFVASLVGVGLLILGWALRRRLDVAWGMTVALLLVGIVASLSKGLDYEEALALASVLIVLLPSRAAFYRKAALTSEALSPRWVVAVALVIGATVWLGLFSYRHVDYSTEMFWTFAVRGNAPRFLRATTGVVAVLLLIAAVRLFRHAPHKRPLPTHDNLAQAATIVAASSTSVASLALLGDKLLAYDASEAAFVMYGVSGGSWIAMGDPVGPLDAGTAAAWHFRRAADAHGAVPVFYQVTAERLPLYLELGLTIRKLGEEALVPLAAFSLAGAERRWMRRNLTDAAKAGLTFEVVLPDAVPAMLPMLRAISDQWLGGKATREKSFSLGRFDETYLRRFPMAVVRAPSGNGSEIVAFANLWCGAPGGEVSPDLMRRSADAPRGVMDFLFIRLLLWAKAKGYSRVSLGMAPLAGLASPFVARPELAPLWSRAGAFVFGRGEAFYNFQGLRAFKEKFGPVWEPRYLASPGGFALPRVLTNVTTLISGGVAGLVRK